MRALLALVIVATGGLFGYDASAPLAWRDIGATDTRDGITVRDVSFAAPKLGRVPAYLVLPQGDGPFPAAVWMPGSRGTREDLVEDARTLAKRGVAALLPQPAGPVLSCPRIGRERETYIRNVVLVRRALDALASLPQIDASRLGAVGFSYGAYVTGSAAGADRRLQAVVLDSGAGRWSRVAREFCRPSARVVASLRAIDPLAWIGRSTATVLIQNGTRDPLTRRTELAALARAAHTSVRYYPATHQLSAQAYADRAAFLARELRPAARLVEDPCIRAGETPVQLKTVDGAAVYGVEVGTGTTGVVLGHQYLSDHCELMDFARELAARGLRAIAIDFRGYGASSGGDGRRLDRDLAAAAARLREDGATRVFLVGASMGGTAALAAASWIAPSVDGVISLSGPAQFRGLDALRAVKRSRVAVRFLASRADRRFAADARTLMKAARAKDKAIVIYAGGRHGSSLLDVPKAKGLALAFLTR
ncbi:MAG TPA: alpha/beta fold hydrolase [Gaiellaceae bacterium]